MRDFAREAAGGHAAWLFEHRFGHEKYGATPEQIADLERNYFRPIFGDLRIERIARAEVGNAGAVGVGFYVLEAPDGRTMPLSINVFPTEDGPCRDFRAFVLDAWRVRAWKGRDPRPYLAFYTRAIAADRAILERHGINGLYLPEPEVPLQTWDALTKTFSRPAEADLLKH